MQTFHEVPGLYCSPNYFHPDRAISISQEALLLFTKLKSAVSRGTEVSAAQIPQPEFVRSERHNLASEEQYTRVELAEPSGNSLKCEYFPRYGEDGHALAYFRGNSNLPDFVAGELLATVHDTVQDLGVIGTGDKLNWKLTANFYQSVNGTVAGFPFHVDIPANGVVTMILNVHEEALFQISRGETQIDIQLSIGGLLILSGESRYEWKHRVLPMAERTETASAEVQRVSLVLGFHRRVN